MECFSACPSPLWATFWAVFCSFCLLSCLSSLLNLLSLDMSYRVHLSKVSLNRTGQDVSILQSAPGLVSKGKGQLIRRKGEQVSEFAHQIGFRQSLGRNRKDALTAC